MLKVNEIFYSIQGESTKAGFPCIIIRLTYCNLRCSYCDTPYSFSEGTERTVQDIFQEIQKYNCKFVELTGGEPLLQPDTHELLKVLCDAGYEVLLETNGSFPIHHIDKRVRIIMDMKGPSSNMVNMNLYDNLFSLKNIDEIKFVIGNREDYDWAKDLIERKDLGDKNILFAPVFDLLEPVKLANWILEDNLNLRLQLQLHKYIWNPSARGV